MHLDEAGLVEEGGREDGLRGGLEDEMGYYSRRLQMMMMM